MPFGIFCFLLRGLDSNQQPSRYTVSIISNGVDYIIARMGREALRLHRSSDRLLPKGIVSTPSPTHGRSLARDCPTIADEGFPEFTSFST